MQSTSKGYTSQSASPGKTLSLSATEKPRAKMILRLVSNRHGAPFSILSTVIGEIPAFLASSVLLISFASRISLTRLLAIFRPNL